MVTIGDLNFQLRLILSLFYEHCCPLDGSMWDCMSQSSERPSSINCIYPPFVLKYQKMWAACDVIN